MDKISSQIYSLCFVGLCLVGISIFSAPLWAEEGAVLLNDHNGRSGAAYFKEKKAVSETFDFHQRKRFALGFEAAGASGLLGTHIELSFTPLTSFQIGFGLAEKFQTFHLRYKYLFSGSSFTSYFSTGYARWYTTHKTGSLYSTEPKFLSERFLNGSQKSSGEFVENMIYPGFGVQYTGIDGELANISLYTEVLLLLDLDDWITAPTAAVGINFYF